MGGVLIIRSAVEETMKCWKNWNAWGHNNDKCTGNRRGIKCIIKYWEKNKTLIKNAKQQIKQVHKIEVCTEKWQLSSKVEMAKNWKRLSVIQFVPVAMY